MGLYIFVGSLSLMFFALLISRHFCLLEISISKDHLTFFLGYVLVNAKQSSKVGLCFPMKCFNYTFRTPLMSVASTISVE